MFDITCKLVKLIALVRNIEHSSTKITYRLEDFTGQIDGNVWLDEEDTLKNPQIMLNNYAEVIGSVRTTNGVKNIMIFKISSVTTVNEVNTHWLEVLGNRYMAEEYCKVILFINFNIRFFNFFLLKKGAGNVAFNPSSTNTGGNAGGTMNFDDTGLKGKPLTIYLAIKECKDDIGISRSDLRQKFSHFSETDMM